MSDSFATHGLPLLQSHGAPMELTRFLYPWDLPGKNTRLDCFFLLQGISLTHGSNPHLQHWQADSLPLSHLGSPQFCVCVCVCVCVCIHTYMYIYIYRFIYLYIYTYIVLCTYIYENIYTFFFRLFSIISYYKVLNTVSCTIK